MEDKTNTPLNSILRQKAEEILQKKTINTIENYSETETLKLLRELEAKKLELEFQNENLKISEENLQSIFDSVAEAIYIIDKTGTYIEVNKSAEQMYQRSREELLGSTARTFAAEGLNDFDEIYKISRSVYETGISALFEFWAVRKNGEIFRKEVMVKKAKYLGKNVLILTARDITERKKIESALHKSQEKLQGIFNAANSGIIQMDTAGHYLMFNDWCCTSLGYSRDEFKELNTISISHPEDVEKTNVLNQKIIDGEIDKYQIEKRFIRKDKSILCCEVFASAIKDSNDNVLSITKILYDLTDKIEARNALEKSESRLIESQIIAKVGSWETDFTFQNPIWSKETARIYGIDENATVFTLDEFLSILHPEDRLRAQTEFVHSIKKNSTGRLEHRIITPAGIEKHIEQRWTIKRNELGEPLLAVGSCHDITERKLAEELVEKSNTRFSSIINSSPVAVALNDENLNITYLNQAFHKMFGYTLEEIPTVQDWFAKAYPNPEYRKKIAKAWILALETVKRTRKDIVSTEVIIRCKDGSDKTIMVSANRLLHSYSSEYLINFYDITERKRTEQALENEKKRLDVILTGTGAATWEWNLNTGIVIINERWAELIGYTLDEIAPIYFDTWRKFTHPEDVKITEEIVEKHCQGILDYFESEFRMKHKNGNWIWIFSRGKINEWDTDGKPLLMSGTHLDITERKLGVEKLIASESLLQQAQITAKIGSFSLDFATQKWTCTTILDQIFGIDASFDKTIEGWKKIIHPEWQTIMVEYLTNVVIGQKSNFNKEYKILTVDTKEERWVHGLGDISFDESGDLKQLVGSIQDITQRRGIENQLKLSSEKFQDLVNSTGGIVWEADAQTLNFTYVSNQAERLLGFAVQEWYADGFWANHIHLEDKNEAIAYCLSHIKKMESYDFTYRFIAKNGEIIWLRDIVNVVVEDEKPRWLRGVMFDITQLKETNLLLSESEEKYRGLVENAPYGILIYIENTVAYINDEGRRMLRAKNKEEIIGKPVLQFVHPDNIENIIQRMVDVTRDNNASDIIEEKFITIDGIPFDVEIKAIPTLYDHKPAVQVIVHDITQRKQSAIELNKINRVYALISQINNLIIRTTNREQLFQEICNIAVDFGKFRMSWIGLLKEDNTITTAAFAGFEEGYFTKSNSPTFIDVAKGRGPTGQALREGRTVICNDIANDPIMKPWRKKALIRGYSSLISIPLIVRNNKIGSFNLYSDEKNFFSSDEEISLLEKITLNIAFALESILTEESRKLTEEKIRQLSQAVEQSPVTILITNTEGKIEYANPKFVETTGYTLKEIIGQNPRILKSGHTTTDEYKELWDTISAGREWHGEFNNKKKDGTLFWESATISPILNTQGKTTHFIAIKENITDRKIAEQELINAKLRAEESDRLKLVFLANMSHEIRTPMNGILGFTGLLKSQNLSPEEQQEYISIIEKSGQRMLNIINDIISISKVESGQIEVTFSETNINEQLNYIHSFFTPESNQKGIQLLMKKILPTKYNLIKTDREKLYAILTNLVKNAIKFTNEGTIEFGCEKKGEYLEFFVKDSGIGISYSQQSIVFERFRQANESVSRSHEGSGLGLAISKAYIDMIGGEIWVDSEMGKGSTFYFTLPFECESHYDDDYVSEEKIDSEKINLEIQEASKIKDLKVLIVEDDSISKLLITIAVKPFSKEILKVSSGIEAIQTCITNPDINLVMMDINMPKMGGYEATKQIRQFNKDLVIIAQTANGMQSDRDEAIKAGCTDYISKPINIKDLTALIQKYFNK